MNWGRWGTLAWALDFNLGLCGPMLGLGGPSQVLMTWVQEWGARHVQLNLDGRRFSLCGLTPDHRGIDLGPMDSGWVTRYLGHGRLGHGQLRQGLRHGC